METDWLNKIKNEYLVNVEEVQVGNDFIDRKIIIRDPSGKACNIEVTINKDGQLSSFSTSEFHFARFNIAEGYKHDDIVNAINLILTAKYVIKRNLIGRRLMLLRIGSVIEVGKSRLLSRDIIRPTPYQKRKK